MHRLLVVSAPTLVDALGHSPWGRDELRVRGVETAQEALALAPVMRPDLVVVGERTVDMPPEALLAAWKALPNLTAMPMLQFGDGPLLPGLAALLSTHEGLDPWLEAVAEALGIPQGRPRRVPLQVLMRLVLQGDGGGRTMFANTVDLSANGVCVAAQDHLSRGAQVQITMVLPGYGRLVVPALVRRTVNADMLHYGLEFRRLSPDDRAMLTAFMASRDAQA